MYPMSLWPSSEEQLYRQENATGIVFIKTGEEEMISFQFHRLKKRGLFVTDASKRISVAAELEFIVRTIKE
jgi:hypothetical protein